MARISVEQTALTDSRYRILAKLLGLADSDHALGRMVHVWNECQERGVYKLPVLVVCTLLRHDSAHEFLITAELARATRDGLIYIRGSKGRVEWLRKRRQDGKLGGKKGGRPRGSISKTLGVNKKHPAETPPAPAPALKKGTPEENSVSVGDRSVAPDSPSGGKPQTRSRTKPNGAMIFDRPPPQPNPALDHEILQRLDHDLKRSRSET